MATSDRGTSPKTGDIELGKKIAARREELGMSRKELAEATSLSYPYIAQIETGYRLPSTKHQVILSKVLGLSLDELFGTGEDLPQMPDRLQLRSATAAPAARTPDADRRSTTRSSMPLRSLRPSRRQFGSRHSLGSNCGSCRE